MKRTSHASSLLETLAVIALLLPIILTIVDGCIFITAINTNNSACRKAARAVSMGTPSAVKKGEPEKNASAALMSFTNSGNSQLIKVLPGCKITENIKQPLPKPPFGGPIDGTATIETHTEAFLPFSCNLMRQGPFILTAKETFAFTWVMPATVTLKALDQEQQDKNKSANPEK